MAGEPTHAAIISRIAVAETKIDDIREDIADIKRRQERIDDRVAELLRIVANAKGGWRVLALVGTIVTFFVGIVGWFAPALIKRWMS